LKGFQESAPFDLVITGDTAQTVDGFGGCFNELGWDALQTLTTGTRDSILKEFFTPDGFNFTICRMPLGANDYSRKFYSYNETAGDFEMKNFSVAHDTTALIPYIREALRHNPDLRVWASPWCPPSWMKVNNHYACRPDSVQNDLTKKGEGKEGSTQFIMKSEYLQAYSLYFSRFLEAYKAEGINIYAVHVQNEPNSCQVFPSCIWAPSALRDFIGKYLGPHFEKQGLNTEIWLGTIERPAVENVDTVLTDALASKYVKGVGFQWAGKGAIPGVHRNYPDMKLMQTETECGDGSNDWKAAEHTWGLIKHYFTNGANSYMYWNLILDETGKSQWGWKQNSMISVDSKTKKAVYNPEYHLMKHLSHFVKPGSKRLITEGWEDALVFANPDGTTVVLAYNPNESEKTLKIRLNDQSFASTLKPKSFNTFSVKL
jgi:glucosylceramidase